MKRIILTESQYKRLVKQKLNEYIVYSDPKDEYDATPDIRLYLGTLGQNLRLKHNVDTYVKKIEDGIVYLEMDKYNEEQKNYISGFIDRWVDDRVVTIPNDKKVGNYDYFSGLDWDYDDEEIEGVEDTEEIEGVEDTEEIEGVEDTEEIEGVDGYIDLKSDKLTSPEGTGNYFRKKNKSLYGDAGHSGYDIKAVDNPVVFLKKGKVKTASFNNDNCGGTITIELEDENRVAIFCHMSEIYVKSGESINPGKIIGVTGGKKNQKGAGHSTGSHLHYGMKRDGVFIDPEDYYKKDLKLIK
jgi:murein DD-endopeptidase MepM/ murein hydrolase activator NlpD